MSVERQYQLFETFEGRFRPTAKRLRKIAEQGTALLNGTTEDQFGVLSEHTWRPAYTVCLVIYGSFTHACAIFKVIDMRADAESRITAYIEDCVFIQNALPSHEGLLNSTGMTMDDLGDGSAVKVVLAALEQFSGSDKNELFKRIREPTDLP